MDARINSLPIHESDDIKISLFNLVGRLDDFNELGEPRLGP